MNHLYNKLSPVAVEVLLHYYYCPNEHEKMDASAYKDAATFFLKVGAFRRATLDDMQDGSFRTTPLGNAWVEAILRTPLPSMVFADSHNNVIANASGFPVDK